MLENVFFGALNSLDADVWKKFLSRPALPFILRLLRGLATQHPPTQVQNTTNFNCRCLIHKDFLSLLRPALQWSLMYCGSYVPNITCNR